MGTSEVITSGAEAIEKVGQSERTLFVGIMFAILLFVGFLIWNSGSNQKEQRESFLSAMEKRDDKMTESLNKMTEALNKNTEVMIELKTKIR